MKKKKGTRTYEGMKRYENVASNYIFWFCIFDSLVLLAMSIHDPQLIISDLVIAMSAKR